MRCFIAIDIENPSLNKLLKELSGFSGIKTVPEKNLHITLKFLGEVEEKIVNEIYNELRELERFKSFEFELRGIDALPNRSYMRVVFAKAEHKNIYSMQSIIDEKLSKLGFARDKRFKSHITLCRVKSSRAKSELLNFIKKYENTSFGFAKCESIRIKKSTLTREGAIYETLKEIKLG